MKINYTTKKLDPYEVFMKTGKCVDGLVVEDSHFLGTYWLRKDGEWYYSKNNHKTSWNTNNFDSEVSKRFTPQPTGTVLKNNQCKVQM